MDRLAEQVVAWHNSHPLAKRITIYDVHTIGVVALPFMRGGRGSAPAAADAAEPIEPVLTDEVSPESLAAALHDDSTIAANENAARLDALADQEELPAERSRWRQLLGGLLRRRGGRKSAFGRIWPAFSERFVEGLTPRRIATFAQDHGFDIRPGDDTWPQRVVPIDDQLAAAGGDGGWPFEIYLMSAAIDAGRSRTRVLVGRGGFKPPVLGRRCLDPKRLVPVLALALALLGGAAALLWPGSGAHEKAAGPASAASAAASAPASAASAAVHQSPASTPAGAASAAASAPAEPASVAASSAVATVQAGEPASAASSAPDIRPQLVEPLRDTGQRRPPMRASTPETSTSAPAGASAAKPATGTAEKTEKAAAPAASAASAPPPKIAALAEESAKVLPQVSGRQDVQEAIAAGKQVVALVGPPLKDKAQAEALLARMREHIAGMQRDPDSLQARIFPSPEGWRAAVWPFGSRAEAQLINATLVARGMRTKAVSF